MPALALTPDDIVIAARGLIGAEGLDRFSMRKLAAALDVNPMTIYLRFDNKDALLDAVAAARLAEFAAPVATGTWSDQALELAIELRRHLIADRETLRVLSKADQLSEGLLSTLDRGIELMSEVCERKADAVTAFRILFWHIVGAALVAGAFDTLPGSQSNLAATFAEAGDTYPHVVSHAQHFGPVDAEALFVQTTTVIIEGLRSGAALQPNPEGHPS